MHGMGNWDGGSYISDSIEHFTKEISRISDFIYEKSIKRSNPRITCEDLDNFVREIIKVDECGDIDIWRSMLEPIYDSTKEYEDTLSKKVKEKAAEGMRIKEISEILNMSVKDTYYYLKSS